MVTQLQQLSRSEGVTLHMTLLAAFQTLLARYSGQSDIAVGTPIAGRNHVEVENLIGFFVNTLVLRSDLSGAPTFRELLGRVRQTSLEAYEHQDLPFEKLVEELQPERHRNRNPLIQVLFQLIEFADDVLDLTGLDVEKLPSPSERARLDLAIHLWAARGRCHGTVVYSSDLFDGETIERLAGNFRTLLNGIVANPDSQIAQLPLLSESERHRVLVEWNDTATDFPRDRCVQQLFEEQVKRTPDAVAVVFESQQLSYAELNRRANRLAHHLCDLGVGPETLVGLCMERSLEMLISVLGILKAGGAFLALDPAGPPQRLKMLIGEAGLTLVLSTTAHAEGLPDGDHTVICVDQLRFSKDRGVLNPPARARGESAAYVLYTSGSTGRPKAVLVEHRQWINYVEAVVEQYGMNEPGAFAMVQPLTVDSCHTMIFPALSRGSTLHLIGRERSLDAFALAEYFAGHRIDYLKIAPSHLWALLAVEKPERLLPERCLILGGEVFHWTNLDRLTQLGGGCQIWNHYGPTETTVGVLTFATGLSSERMRERSATVPIGRPLANVRCYVLDGSGHPVPRGVPGELYLGGDVVARGYLNRRELTAQQFVADPFSPSPEARMYRTGDMVRWLPDGVLEFLGRLDTQVKLRGFRIELGEIEWVLGEHPGVAQVVVLLREDVSNHPHLAAYVVPEAADTLSVQNLRQFVGSRLPEAMIPAAMVILPTMPRTPHGKVDRRALAALDIPSYASRAYEAPVGEIETALAEIWAEVLKLDRVGRRDHFFELGGHSLLAVSTLERMRRAGLHAEVEALFVTPVLSELAAAVGGDGGVVEVPPNRIPPVCEAITPEMLPLVQLTSGEIERIAATVPGGATNIQDIYPLAPLQEGILFHHLMATGGDPYLNSAVFGFDNRERLERYLDALQAVIDRHDILRTSVQWEGLSEPVQVVWRGAPLVVEEVVVAPASGDVAQQLGAHFDPRHYQLDVGQAPLMRVFIAHDAANARWVMLQLSHHLSTDHTTLEVVQGEIQAHLLGQADRLPVPLPFRNFVAQTRLGVSREEHEAFFQKMLGDVDEPTTPFGLTDVHGDGSDSAEARQRVDASLARRLRERTRALGVSPASVCHLAWAQVLARVSGRDDVVFGTVLFGRMQGGAGADRVLGLFINTLPVRIRVDDQGIEDSVRHTHAVLAEVLHHEHAPLALAQRCSAVAAPAPLFSALLNYRHSAAAAHGPTDGRQTWQGLQWEGMQSLGSESRSTYPLTLSVDDAGEGFALTVQVQTPIDPERVCAYMHTALEQVVGALESAPSTPLRSVDVLPALERHQLLAQWNDTTVAYPNDCCVHELVEDQVVRTPDHNAVEYDGAVLTYADLEGRANQLANYLRGLGVVTGTMVGLCLDRSEAMVVAMLAILKTGGAYVPLDPTYPRQRPRYMLQDTAARVVVTESAHVEMLGTTPAQLVCLERDGPSIAACPDAPPGSDATAGDVAYVIYTSGSTGQAKGVCVPHRAINRLVVNADYVQLETTDRVAQASNANFDAATFEIWGALIHGARLVGVSKDVLLSAPLLAEHVRHHGINVMFLTTALFNQLIQEMPNLFAPFRYVLFGGQAVDPKRVRECLSYGRGQKLLHVYGPTEATTFATWHEVTAVSPDAATVPIGRPIANTQVYILDERMNPIPIGVPGELYIGGPGLANEYLNQPELAAEKFVNNPFAVMSGEKLYRTGDLVRWNWAGNLEFLGRLDDQVKIRGFRVELGEIEVVLAQHDHVVETVVLAREDIPGDTQLVAYAVPNQDHVPTVEELRRFLTERLPDYMVPAAFVTVEAWPLTPNGKVDRRALAALDVARRTPEATFVAPRDAVEASLASIWTEVLGMKQIGIHDNFFELGGHSLLATRVIALTGSIFRVDIPLRCLFERPTIAGLADTLVEHETKPGQMAAISRLRQKLDKMSPEQVHDVLRDKGSPRKPI